MRKSYLPTPPPGPGRPKPRRVFDTVPLEPLLTRPSTQFECLQLAEPQLLFAGNNRCVDPKTGLAAYGPYWKGDAKGHRHLRVGIVGTEEGIKRAHNALQEISGPVEQTPDVDCIVHPSFPGLNSASPFELEIITQPLWHRCISPNDVGRLKIEKDRSAAERLLRTYFADAVRALAAAEYRPDLVLCVLSEEMGSLLVSARGKDLAASVGSDSQEAFGMGLEATSMGSLPVHLLYDRLLPNADVGRSPANEAWDLTLQLLRTAGLTPWVLADTAPDECFVGMSYHQTSEKKCTIVARIHTGAGRVFMLKDEAFPATSNVDDCRVARFNEEQASRLAYRLLSLHEQQTGYLPRKIAIHRNSPFTEEERRGFAHALGKLEKYGLVTILRRGIFCLRPGAMPIQRGTAVVFGDKLGFVYTSGYVPFLKCYPGNRMPQPFEIVENWGSLSFQEVAEDLLKLTKLDWATSDFYAEAPVTLAPLRSFVTTMY